MCRRKLISQFIIVANALKMVYLWSKQLTSKGKRYFLVLIKLCNKIVNENNAAVVW